ncbi:9177_t:CDS:2 [Paraglomus occultum]|uniref:9177_t:CDS:1 n=1 Tax=Paraglomus occultum TaxID=144539 RepID=A0A9N9AKG2_9GLOM|nr:9177_t:CDS:2 [Paraglomus occultum]
MGIVYSKTLFAHLRTTTQGTSAQCELQNIFSQPRRHLYPELGITLIESSNDDNDRLWFNRYTGTDMNTHSRGLPLYELKMDVGNIEKQKIRSRESTHSSSSSRSSSTSSSTSSSMSSSTSSSASSSSSSRHFSIQLDPRQTLPIPSRTNPFATTKHLPQVLSMINSHISTIYPTSERDQKIHIAAYFGKELFFNIPNECQGDFFTYEDWHSVKRDGNEGMRSSYQHSCDLFEGYEKIERMDLGFMRSNVIGRHGHDENENSLSVTLYFQYEGDGWKAKLKYDDKEACWKPTKLARSLRRVILLDIVSTTGAPDIRFTVKTQKRVPISEKIDNIIKEVQQSKNRESHASSNDKGQRRMTFSVEDFKGKLAVTRIDEVLTKQKFCTDTYRLLLYRTLYSAATGQVSQNLNVKLKHYKWVNVRHNSCLQESSTDDGSHDEEADNRRKENIQRKLHALTTSIEEGVMFARLLCNRLEQA